jgi:hypothetical protein
MGAATIEPLGPSHVAALKAMLARDVTHNMYLLGLMEEFGVVSGPTKAPFTFYGRFLDGQLTACLFVGGNGGLVVPSAGTTREIADLAKHIAGKVSLKSVMGERNLVDALLTHLAAGTPVVHSRQQRMFSVSADDMGPFTNPLLRLATEADLPRLVPLAAACVQEMLQRDPLKEDPEGFPNRVKQRVKAKRTYVLEEKGQLVFKLDVGSRSQYGAELEALYTLPDERQKGHATLCLGQISRFLLSSLPRLTLRVDDENPGLATVARKVGYLPYRPQRLCWLE